MLLKLLRKWYNMIIFLGAEPHFLFLAPAGKQTVLLLKNIHLNYDIQGQMQFVSC